MHQIEQKKCDVLSFFSVKLITHNTMSMSFCESISFYSNANNYTFCCGTLSIVSYVSGHVAVASGKWERRIISLFDFVIEKHDDMLPLLALRAVRANVTISAPGPTAVNQGARANLYIVNKTQIWNNLCRECKRHRQRFNSMRRYW